MILFMSHVTFSSLVILFAICIVIVDSKENGLHGFSHGTLIPTHEGPVPIELITEKHLVWAFDEVRKQDVLTPATCSFRMANKTNTVIYAQNSSAKQLPPTVLIIGAHHPVYAKLLNTSDFSASSSSSTCAFQIYDDVENSGYDWIRVEQCTKNQCKLKCLLSSTSQVGQEKMSAIQVSMQPSTTHTNEMYLYNLHVPHYHNYYVMINGAALLVHNYDELTHLSPQCRHVFDEVANDQVGYAWRIYYNTLPKKRKKKTDKRVNDLKQTEKQEQPERSERIKQKRNERAKKILDKEEKKADDTTNAVSSADTSSVARISGQGHQPASRIRGRRKSEVEDLNDSGLKDEEYKTPSTNTHVYIKILREAGKDAAKKVKTAQDSKKEDEQLSDSDAQSTGPADDQNAVVGWEETELHQINLQENSLSDSKALKKSRVRGGKKALKKSRVEVVKKAPQPEYDLRLAAMLMVLNPENYQYPADDLVATYEQVKTMQGKMMAVMCSPKMAEKDCTSMITNADFKKVLAALYCAAYPSWDVEEGNLSDIISRVSHLSLMSGSAATTGPTCPGGLHLWLRNCYNNFMYGTACHQDWQQTWGTVLQQSIYRWGLWGSANNGIQQLHPVCKKDSIQKNWRPQNLAYLRVCYRSYFMTGMADLDPPFSTRARVDAVNNAPELAYLSTWIENGADVDKSGQISMGAKFTVDGYGRATTIDCQSPATDDATWLNSCYVQQPASRNSNPIAEFPSSSSSQSSGSSAEVKSTYVSISESTTYQKFLEQALLKDNFGASDSKSYVPSPPLGDVRKVYPVNYEYMKKSLAKMRTTGSHNYCMVVFSRLFERKLKPKDAQPMFIKSSSSSSSSPPTITASSASANLVSIDFTSLGQRDQAGHIVAAKMSPPLSFQSNADVINFMPQAPQSNNAKLSKRDFVKNWGFGEIEVRKNSKTGYKAELTYQTAPDPSMWPDDEKKYDNVEWWSAIADREDHWDLATFLLGDLDGNEASVTNSIIGKLSTPGGIQDKLKVNPFYLRTQFYRPQWVSITEDSGQSSQTYGGSNG